MSGSVAKSASKLISYSSSPLAKMSHSKNKEFVSPTSEGYSPETKNFYKQQRVRSIAFGRSPFGKTPWKDLRFRGSNLLIFRYILVLALLCTIYGFFEPDLEPLLAWRHKDMKEDRDKREFFRQNPPPLSDIQILPLNWTNKDLPNASSTQKTETLSILNSLHKEINYLENHISTESELERLNFDGKNSGFGGETSGKVLPGEQLNEHSGIEDGYDEEKPHNEASTAGSSSVVQDQVFTVAGNAESMAFVKPYEPLREWNEAFLRAVKKIPPSNIKLWQSPDSRGFSQCIERSERHKIPVQNRTNGYLMVTANGGLNQMRSAICDMVAVTRIMNATLVVPGLDHTSFWNDTSEFEDIFDLEHFVKELRDDIRIVKQLPETHMHIKPYLKVPISWSPAKFYRSEVLPLLKKVKVIYFPLTDSRLANNNISYTIQRVRCRANFRALKHTRKIELVSNALIMRLRFLGPYIGLHLRYEKDMLAFTGCSHGLLERESEELRGMRLKNARWKEKEINGHKRRLEGACPLTPRETALFLRALGYPNDTVIYIAAGDIYGENGLGDLLAMFPRTFTHSSLAKTELQTLGGCQNQHAAVDYEVAFQSNVFVATFEGNMAKTVQGHRRFEGHRPTIIPDRKSIVQSVDRYDRKEIGWDEFKDEILKAHVGRFGGPSFRVKGKNPKTEDNFFANPLPGCICESRHSRNSQSKSRESKLLRL